MKTIPFQDKSKGIAWAYLGMGKGFWRNFWEGLDWVEGKNCDKIWTC